MPDREGLMSEGMFEVSGFRLRELRDAEAERDHLLAAVFRVEALCEKWEATDRTTSAWMVPVAFAEGVRQALDLGDPERSHLAGDGL